MADFLNDPLGDHMYKTYPDGITIPPEYAYFVEKDLMSLLIKLARYKFVARMLKKTDCVLDIGCCSGLGSIFLSQHCAFVKGIDINKAVINAAKKMNPRNNIEFENIDFFHYQPNEMYDVIVSLDLIEHISEEDGRKFTAKTSQHLKTNGMLILGTPSCYSSAYQSDGGKISHIKLYDQKELVELVETFYGRAIAFSMNDELVHTGFSKLAWYYFVLAFYPKALD